MTGPDLPRGCGSATGFSPRAGSGARQRARGHRRCRGRRRDAPAPRHGRSSGAPVVGDAPGRYRGRCATTWPGTSPQPRPRQRLGPQPAIAPPWPQVGPALATGPLPLGGVGPARAGPRPRICGPLLTCCLIASCPSSRPAHPLYPQGDRFFSLSCWSSRFVQLRKVSNSSSRS